MPSFSKTNSSSKESDRLSPNIASVSQTWKSMCEEMFLQFRAQAADMHGQMSRQERGQSRRSYRVLFRRKISLIKGCVKLTSPFLDMLVTRSLWSKMCKSMLSGFVLFVCFSSRCSRVPALAEAKRSEAKRSEARPR